MSRRGVALAFSAVLAASVSAAGAPTATFAHDTSTPQGHLQEDLVQPHDRATERRLDQHTMAVTATDAAAAAAGAGSASEVGQWGPVVDWPVVAVHMALLENGKVLAYDSIGDNATESYPVQDH